VLVVGGENAGMDHCTPWNFDPLVDGLRADDAGGSDFVGHFTCLIEDESQDVLVVGDGDNGLNDKLSISNHHGSTGTVVGVFPANPRVLLVDTNNVLHGHCITLVGSQNRVEVVDYTKTIAARFQVIGHDTGTGIAKVEGGFPVKWRPRIGVRDVHL